MNLNKVEQAYYSYKAARLKSIYHCLKVNAICGQINRLALLGHYYRSLLPQYERLVFQGQVNQGLSDYCTGYGPKAA